MRSNLIVLLSPSFNRNLRNSRVVDIVKELADFGCKVDVYDPWAASDDVKHEYGFPLIDKGALEAGGYDAVVLAVAHEKFRALDVARLKNENGVIYDVKSFLDPGVVDGRL